MLKRSKLNPKRLLLILFVLAWISGFLLTALSPLYRWIYAGANGQSIDLPYQLFETSPRTHPRYYADLRQAFRQLVAQVPADKPIYLFFSSDSRLNTPLRRQQLDEYAFIWAYPHELIDDTRSWDNLAEDSYFILSASNSPADEDCATSGESLFLCH